ncbi:MAG: Exopolysaccharide biosynthesis polyprenyl glycosylphosphotransferase [Parcubacteria group bacterium GW2011_GWA2_43_9b]|nr:MAG: Exopolysaccharide biosynthesis polyprenyl glycosylphosphotransferase [Parcubacteria group bacterium GW2011_GWA2_43_9b]
MKKSELIFTAALVPVDYAMLILAGLAAYWLRTSSLVAAWRPVLFGVNLPLEKYLGLVALIGLFMLVIFALTGLYEIRRANGILEDFARVLIGASAGLAIIIIYSFLRREWFDSRFLIFAAWILAIFFVLLGRTIIRAIQKFLLSRYNFGVHNVLVVGGDKISREIIDEIKNKSALGYNLVRHFQDLDLAQIKETVKNESLDDIILANPDWSREQVLGLIDFCDEKRLNFKFVPNLFQALTINVEFDALAGIPLVELKRTALDGWGKIIKRTMDFFGAIFGIIIFSPVMFIVAILVKLDSRGPIIYKNERVGPEGIFNTYKFRSMKLEYCTGSEYDKDGRASDLEDELAAKQSGRKGPVFKVINDPRRTRLGRFLEASSLDELPQFFNVMLGQMSLVGPRPHMPKEVAGYEKWHKRVFNVKPGITGLAQISGRSEIDFDEEAKLDAYYIENWSLWMDWKILLKTPLVVILGRRK